MTRIQFIVVLGVISFLWITSVGGNTEVSCVFMESCILPCSFTLGSNVVIHWHQLKAEGLPVHSFNDNQDQLGDQDQNFRGRTSLFKDQISRGNASLQLTGVKVQDEGRYRCYTGNKESYINLKVDAPVHEVNIVQEGNRITCSSNLNYPEPELTWSTTPPSKETFKDTTTVQQTEQQLYNISSSLILSDSDSDLVYSCTISTGTNKRRNQRRATFRRLLSINGSTSETTISCSDSNTPLTTLIWRFNHSQIVVTWTRTDVSYTVSEEWRQQVKDVSESGSLTLQDLSSNQEGIYTCELRDEEETNFTNIFLRINKDQVEVGGIIGGVVGAISAVVVAGVVMGLYCKKKKGQPENQESNRNGNQISREDGGETVALNDLEVTSGSNQPANNSALLPPGGDSDQTHQSKSE
ncbi:CD276 antigen-like [Mugil cephalus]|uniref:CD276 antigen-like n=1 Tax=Mugil cephalus TaxID=48193 RepID=UPI001FB7C570|nr:CD276 antigen-like [Mugil cephalus]